MLDLLECAEQTPRFFDIVPETGTLLSNAVWDYEARATYSVTVHVQDGRQREGRPNTGIDDSIDRDHPAHQ